MAPIVPTYILILTNRHSVRGPTANGPDFRAATPIAVTAVAGMSFAGRANPAPLARIELTHHTYLIRTR
jgi:hypothetical protein